MKKIYYKIATAILTMCLAFSCFTFVTHAAEGTLQFSDPSAAAGENVTVTAKVNANDAILGDIDITVTYDSSILKFVSGTNATGADGTVNLTLKGDGASQEAAFSMEFTALKEGTASLQAAAYTAFLSNDESLNLVLGTSAVTIQGGTPVTTEETAGQTSSVDGLQVDVDGTRYTVNANFSEAVIPNGFVAADTELDGKTTKAMLQESSGQYLYYLTDSEGNSDYFLYSTDDGSFTATEVVDVNPDVTLFLMNHKDKEGLPSEFKETTTTVAGKEFTAWNNVSNTDYYLVYALSSEGTKGYYQYDTAEKTYQRYEVQAVAKEEKATGLAAKIISFMEDHMTIILCAVWGVFLVLLIFIIVLAVKLSHRNQELDDVYDEYGIGDDDTNKQPKTKKNNKEQFVGFNKASDNDFEDFDEDYDDEDFEDEGSENGYGDFEDDDFEDDYEDDGYEDDEQENYDFEDDFEVEDDFETYQEPASKRRGKNKERDDYSVDFIDI